MSIKNNQDYIKIFSFSCYLAAVWQLGVGLFHLFTDATYSASYEMFANAVVFALVGFINQKFQSRIIGIIISLLLFIVSIGTYGMVNSKGYIQSSDYVKGDIGNAPWLLVVLFMFSVRSLIAIFKYRKDKDYFNKRKEQK